VLNYALVRPGAVSAARIFIPEAAIIVTQNAKVDVEEIKLFTSNATRSVVDALVSGFERASGCKITVIHDSAKVMLARIKSGETADVAVLLTHAIDELVSLGRITAASRRPFSRSIVGIAVLAGKPKPDISSLEAFKRTLLEAKSIAHTVNGASGMYFPKMAERLGIAAQISHKIVTRPGGLIGRVVAAGKAEIAFQQISELLSVPGIDLVGPLPPEVQVTIESAAGIFSDSKNPAMAQALIDFFSAPSAADVFRAKGLEPGPA
jgi:molybdate transport system substrate-binding protein